MARPWSTVSSPVLTMAVMLGRRHDLHEPGEEAGGADAAAQHGDHGAASMAASP